MMSNASARVTVGMPVYNAERYLAEALESVLAQTYRDFQLIICDNASTDGTPDLCREYASGDSRIHVVASTSNRGAAWNYNRSFELCRTPYFMWVAHDDRLLPTFLEKAVDVLERDLRVALCYSRTRFIGPDGAPLKVAEDDLHLDDPDPVLRFRRFLLRYRVPDFCNPIFGLFRTAVLEKTGRIGPYQSSDMILLGETALNGLLIEIPEVLFERRDHPDRSVLKYATPEQRAEWFLPGSGAKKQHVEHRWFFEYLRAIRRAKLGPTETLECVQALLSLQYAPVLKGTMNRRIDKARRSIERLKGSRS